MLNIYLCDDEKSQLSLLQETIEKDILIHEYEMQIALCCSTPAELLCHLKDNSSQISLYFLDIDLQSDIDGFELAQQIRNWDPRAFIVIVTTHSEMLPLTFHYMIEPLAYIIKNNIMDMQEQICNCLSKVWDRYRLATDSKINKQYFSVSTNTKRIDFNVNDLYYITLSSIPHVLEICGKDTLTQVRGTINEALLKLPKEFIKISRETIINSEHIKKYDRKRNGIILTNDTFFQISSRKQKEIKKNL